VSREKIIDLRLCLISLGQSINNGVGLGVDIGLSKEVARRIIAVTPDCDRRAKMRDFY
jgi:hypothetical protein